MKLQHCKCVITTLQVLKMLQVLTMLQVHTMLQLLTMLQVLTTLQVRTTLQVHTTLYVLTTHRHPPTDIKPQFLAVYIQYKGQPYDRPTLWSSDLMIV